MKKVLIVSEIQEAWAQSRSPVPGAQRNLRHAKKIEKGGGDLK